MGGTRQQHARTKKNSFHARAVDQTTGRTVVVSVDTFIYVFVFSLFLGLFRLLEVFQSAGALVARLSS